MKVSGEAPFSTPIPAYSRRAALRGAVRMAGGGAIGVLAGTRADAPSRARAAGLATILHNNQGYTCDGALFVAQDQGYFRDEGLELTILDGPGGADFYGRLAKGTADAWQNPAWALAPPFLPPGIAVGDAVATAGLQRGCASLLVGAGSPYRTLADLRGQKVATPPVWRFIFGEPLSQAGVDPKKEINWQPQPAYAAVGAALANKDVAAAMALQPYAAMLESSGVARALVVQDMPPMGMDYCCGVVVSGALLRTDRSKAAAITRALLRGSAWAAANPTATAQLEVAGKHVPASLADNLTGMATIAFAPAVADAHDNTGDMLGRMLKLGFLDPATDVSALLGRIFVPVAGEITTSGLPKSGEPALPASITAIVAGLGLVGLGAVLRRRSAR